MSALVLIPTYNERDNLPLIVGGVLAHDDTRVLVLDDGSPDGTGEVGEALARAHPGRVSVMHRTGPRGLGRSYLDGFRAALAGMRAWSVRWTPICRTIRSSCRR
jgi:dolichol-phosphate mannosyltransferase